MASSKCIYCGRFFNPRAGEGDHVLAARLFGEFEGAATFRGCCRRCNNSFGEYEQLLSQATPLGFYRQIVRPNLGRRRRRGGLQQRSAKGAKRPKHTSKYRGYNLIVHQVHGAALTVTHPDQIVIRDLEGIDHQIRVVPQMTVEAVRKEISKLKLSGIHSGAISCDDKNTTTYQSLLGKVIPSLKITDTEVSEAGLYQTQGRISFQFSGDAYFQAIAKQAFHYYLLHNRRGYRGDEPEFQGIRTFIKRGGSKDVFFTAAGRDFRLPLGRSRNGRALVPSQWCHVLAVDETISEAVVYLDHFLGPKKPPKPTYVTLGPVDSRILPEAIWGHVFQYEPGRRGRYAGRMIEARIMRVNR